MKKAMVLVGALLVAALSVNVLAIGNVGPATAELKCGQWSVGGEYWYGDMSLDRATLKGTYVYTDEDGVADPVETLAEKMDIDNVKTNFSYVSLGYGISDNWEVFGRIGIADIKADTRSVGDDEWLGTNFDNDMAWGVGTRYTFIREDKVRWGISAQMNWFDTSSSEKSSWVHDNGEGDELDVATDEVDWDGYDLLISVGPTIDMDGGWKLYAGPFYYMIDGDADLKETEVDTWVVDDETMTDLEVTRLTGDLEEDSCFGGHVGAIFPLASNTDLAFEVAVISGGWAAGTSLTMKF
jgi:hypothetical protein